ncbi:SHOCT domain-containing protein [Clostridium algoriphilum]|nr:SHOCT domain-containing protein [Clostridium algoriphilum]MCB2295781.1 SHOCT domain-containing protein [Clostridium algoriphilum]
MQLEGNQQRVTDEIMKYKELLDEGIITKEEFSVKEEELLFSIRKRM